MANNTLQQLIESANPWQSMQAQSKGLAAKWEKSGLLEGLKGNDRSTMAMMLENQAKELIVESSTTGTGGSFTPGSGEQWSGVALPLVRKVFGQIASKEFVSVQPMSLPAGLVFYLDFQYGTTKTPFSAGNSLYGTTNAFNTQAAGGLYGPGRYGYTINQFSASVTSSNVTIASASYADTNFDVMVSASVVGGTIKKLTIATTASIDSNIDPNGIKAFIITSGGLDTTRNLQAYTTITGANINFFITASTAEVSGALSGNWQVFYNKKTNDNNRGDFEDGSTYSIPNSVSSSVIAIPEINIAMRSEGIVAKTRKLKAQWSPEFAQDLNAYQNLDAEAELTAILSEYISLEVDLEILDMLIVNAPTQDAWSAVVGNQINAGFTAFNSNTAGVYYQQMSWFQTIGIKLQKLSNQIHQKTLRGGANFIVISPTVATVIESIPGYASDTDGDATSNKYAFGIQKVGSLNSRFKVYKNPYMIENVILLGYRGAQFLETGAVYAPYIPLIMTPLVMDPNTFTPRKGIMTRYAKKLVRADFYARLFVADLNIV